jgi:integrase
MSVRKSAGFLPVNPSATISLPPVPARKRGKRMSRRKGQNPKVRVKARADGQKVYFFQYRADIPGEESRRRLTEVVGLTRQMTRSEAERKKLEFISNLKLNSNDYRIPSSATFANAAKHYREVFAPRMLRPSTISVAEGRIKVHLEADWKDVPIEHINIDSVNEWAWKKRQSGLSWVTIKDALRTMQRVLSAFSKDRKPPFSQTGLAIPDRDKLQMKIRSRHNVSFTWAQSEQIAGYIRSMDSLGDARKKQYAALILLAAASGLRSSELLALKTDDLDFNAGTFRVDESSDQRSNGVIGPCKNAAAYRTVVLRDVAGQKAMRTLKQLLGASLSHELIFRSRSGGPLLESTILSQGLHPALKALGLPKGGLHGFRQGCNRRWELAGINPAVIRQQMGHTSARMTMLYSGEIPIDQVQAAFSTKTGTQIVVLETMETEAAA